MTLNQTLSRSLGRSWHVLGLLALLAPVTSFAITAGQLDDFEDGTTAGWSEGAFSTNPPVNVGTGGPDGALDNYVSNTSNGEFLSPGGRMTMFNTAQWTGDFVSAGISSIQMRLANFGTTPLAIRIAFEGAITQISSTNAFNLPPDGSWYTATFGLGPGDLSVVGGAATVNAVLADVTMMRILSRSGGPGWQGDEIAGVMGVDRVLAMVPSAVGETPVPGGAHLGAAPNPFAGSTKISFTLAREGSARLQVFDIGGRSVRGLFSGRHLSTGAHSIEWDGRDDSGRLLPAGTYWIRLTLPDGVETRKIQRIR